MMADYKEINILYFYCLKQGIYVTLEEKNDGFAVRFQNGMTVEQHYLSNGSESGCVEPHIGSHADGKAVKLENAKLLVRRHKERLRKGPVTR